METLGPPPAWMLGAAKRTNSFFRKVPSAAATAAAAPGISAGDGFMHVLYSKEEFEAANNCQVGVGLYNMCASCLWYCDLRSLLLWQRSFAGAVADATRALTGVHC